MVILVTGGAGYIGSHTCSRLVDLNHSVIVLDDLSTGRMNLLPPKIRFFKGNAGNPQVLRQIFDSFPIDSVIHFAGWPDVEGSVKDPLRFYENNTCASRELISTCLNYGVQNFIFSSTAAVYGNPNSLPVDESTPVSPISPYGRSKLMTEWIIQDSCIAQNTRFPLRYVILRYFNVAGARVDGSLGQVCENATHLIKISAEVVLGKRNSITIFGTDYDTPDGTGVRDYVHVDDLAQAHIHALDYLSQGGDSQVVNAGYGRGFSVRQVIRAMEEVSNTRIPIVEGPRRRGDPPALFCSGQRIRNLFGWEPHFDDLATICESALNWEKSLQFPQESSPQQVKTKTETPSEIIQEV